MKSTFTWIGAIATFVVGVFLPISSEAAATDCTYHGFSSVGGLSVVRPAQIERYIAGYVRFRAGPRARIRPFSLGAWI